MYKIVKNDYKYVVGILSGVLYGIVCQTTIRSHALSDLYGAISFGYIFILPFILGFITILYATKEQRESWKYRIFAPIGTILLSLLFSLLVGWEGAICLIMAALIFIPLASLGGIISGITLTYLHNRKNIQKLNTSWLVLVLILPTISAYIESYFNLPIQKGIVETEIEISSTRPIIWKNIIRVPLITERLDGFFYKMGFPKPLEATLSYEGVGGVRNASFERGLTFIEVVDVWEKEKKISFSISTHPESIPTTTLDEHVVVGGRYFDVLRGTYEIIPVSESKSILKLSSEVRVSTRFNFYTNIWAKFLMKDIQNTILKVIKERCENDELQNNSPIKL